MVAAILDREHTAVGATPPLQIGSGAMAGIHPIDKAVASLRNGGQLVIDTNLNIHRSRSDCLECGSAPVLTISRHEDNLIIYPGLPSKHGTFSGNSSSRIDQPVIIPSGNSISIGRIEIQLPEGSTATESPLEIKKIVEDIAKLKSGERLEIGRFTYPELPANISRIHASVECLGSVELNGVKKKIYQVFDGALSGVQAECDTENGGFQTIMGQITLGAGRKIVLQGVSITVPDYSLLKTVPDPELHYNTIMGVNIDTGLKGVVLPRGHVTVVHDHTIHMLNDDDLCQGQPLNRENIWLLAHHIRKGLKIIAEPDEIDGRQKEVDKMGIPIKYSRAMRHFAECQPLEGLGYTISSGRCFSLDEISVKAIKSVLSDVAENSWFWTDRKTISPASALLNPDIYPRNTSERELLRGFFRELALIYAEENIHAYQHILRRNVSKKGILLGENAHEADIAEMFREHGVEMSGLFLNERYEERQKVLQKLRGGQTTDDVEGVKAAIMALDPGCFLLIGREFSSHPPGPDMGNMKVATIKQKAVVSPPEEVPNVRKEAFDGISRMHAIVTKLPQGGYEVRDPNSRRGIYAPDSCGIWRKVEGKIVLPPGTKFRLGRFFELSLP